MTPVEAQRIVQDYGAVLEERTAMGVIRDINSLPRPKVQIKEALIFALRATADRLMREHLKVAYISLADFQELSDGQVKALQGWNSIFAKKPQEMTLEELRNEAIAGSKVADKAVAIQEKSAAEAQALALERRAAGF